ncbi:MAG: hypothetical protein J0H68_05300 [Sphingobacteriia bacterium]|nr:hypothetical protein [Sphingobacteriia bacterium]
MSERDKQLEEKLKKINSLSKEEKQEVIKLVEEFIKEQEKNSNKEGAKGELSKPELLEKLEGVLEKLKVEGDIKLTPEELELLEKIGVKESWLKKAMNFLLPKVLANFIIASAKTFLGLEPQADKAIIKDDLIKEFQGKAEASKAASNEQQQQESQSKENPSKQSNESLAALKNGASEGKAQDNPKDKGIPFDPTAEVVNTKNITKVAENIERNPDLLKSIESVSKTTPENNFREERTSLNQENLRENKKDNGQDKDSKEMQRKTELQNLYGDDKVNDAKLVEAAKTAATPQKQFEAGMKQGQAENPHHHHHHNHDNPANKAMNEAKSVGENMKGKVEAKPITPKETIEPKTVDSSLPKKVDIENPGNVKGK